jgi:hypothetical protein
MMAQAPRTTSPQPLDQEDTGLFQRLTFAGVSIVTLTEGDITHLHIGFKGTMNALFLKDPQTRLSDQRREDSPDHTCRILCDERVRRDDGQARTNAVRSSNPRIAPGREAGAAGAASNRITS